MKESAMSDLTTNAIIRDLNALRELHRTLREQNLDDEGDIALTQAIVTVSRLLDTFREKIA
jgi:hypothetical protein